MGFIFSLPRSSLFWVTVLVKTFGALGSAALGPQDLDDSVLRIFMIMILKVCQQVCQNLWSRILQYMSDCGIFLLYKIMVKSMKSLQSKQLKQSKDCISITKFSSFLLSKIQPVQCKTRHRNKSSLQTRQQVHVV